MLKGMVRPLGSGIPGLIDMGAPAGTGISVANRLRHESKTHSQGKSGFSGHDLIEFVKTREVEGSMTDGVLVRGDRCHNARLCMTFN